MSTFSVAHSHPLQVLHTKYVRGVETLLAIWQSATSSDRLRYPPSLNSILEDAAMAREMRRL